MVLDRSPLLAAGSGSRLCPGLIAAAQLAAAVEDLCPSAAVRDSAAKTPSRAILCAVFAGRCTRGDLVGERPRR